jgi:metal-responsive CopG/Arc/MetJ family transcriptional regulator
MSTRTTVVLEDDVLERVKRVSRSRGTSFRETLNDLLRTALLDLNHTSRRSSTFKVRPIHMGYNAGFNNDSVEWLLEQGEGKEHR